jgi:hypothetical protein
MDEWFWNSISVGCYWERRPMSVDEYIYQVREYLLILRSKFSQFSQLHIVKKTKSTNINPENKINFSELMLNSLPEWAYINSDSSDKIPKLTSICKSSYHTSFSNTPDGRDAIIVRIATGGSDDDSNLLTIQCYDQSVSSEFIEDLLKLSVQFWNANEAMAGREVLFRAFKQPLNEARLGWLTFIKTPNAINYLPDKFQTSLFNAGLLIKISDEIPLGADADSVASLTDLKSALQRRDFLNRPRATE